MAVVELKDEPVWLLRGRRSGGLFLRRVFSLYSLRRLLMTTWRPILIRSNPLLKLNRALVRRGLMLLSAQHTYTSRSTAVLRRICRILCCGSV